MPVIRWRPRLAGATLGDRAWAAAGAALGIAGTAVACAMLAGHALPLIVAPIGASAVLVFAVPASPLAQPRAVILGNVLSTLIGIAVAQTLGHGALAAGVAVGAAILAMSLTRSLHPPGGAAALAAVIGGPVVWEAGWRFALLPVGANAVVLAALGWLFHRWSGHSYPHVPPAPPPTAERVRPADIDAALAEAGEAFDITREDLARLIAAAEAAAERRRRG